MRFRKPLAEQELHDIGVRNRESADVITLLWEIKRLRALVLRADKLQRSLGNVGGGAGLILEALRNELKNEPCVKEFQKSDIEK
jgi:hypothetical protein